MSALRELAAFPAHIHDEVAFVLAEIATGQWSGPSAGDFCVVVDHETVEIPRRVYYDADRVRASTGRDDVRGRIALCLGSIHHDGHLRQRCAERLLTVDEPWVVPFIVNLVGEYVLEIVACIDDALPRVNARRYGGLLADNAGWFATIERRVISYWNVYHRGAFPDFARYPGARAIARLRAFVLHSRAAPGHVV